LFDCLHDIGDPVGAMKFVNQSLKPDGTCMIIEPMTNDKVEENINLIGRVYYPASSLICVPNSLTDNGPELDAHAGEKKIKEIAENNNIILLESVEEEFESYLHHKYPKIIISITIS
jgi:hypothetical protein